jgi:glutathione S-transferase
MKITKFKLYHFPATRSARVKWMLHEVLGNDFEVEQVELFQGQQYQQDYLAKNPNHAVPVLELTLENGETQTMLESGAMVTLLADLFAEKKLAPDTLSQPIARADYLHMLYFGASWMDMMLWQIRMHRDVLPEEDRDLKTQKRYVAKFADEVEPQLIKRLTEHDYICGDHFSAADCIITHNVMWAKSYGLCTDDIYSNYLSKVTKRPAFMAAFADAKQFSHQVPEDSNLSQQITG